MELSTEEKKIIVQLLADKIDECIQFMNTTDDDCAYIACNYLYKDLTNLFAKFEKEEEK